MPRYFGRYLSEVSGEDCAGSSSCSAARDCASGHIGARDLPSLSRGILTAADLKTGAFYLFQRRTELYKFFSDFIASFAHFLCPSFNFPLTTITVAVT